MQEAQYEWLGYTCSSQTLVQTEMVSHFHTRLTTEIHSSTKAHGDFMHMPNKKLKDKITYRFSHSLEEEQKEQKKELKRAASFCQLLRWCHCLKIFSELHLDSRGCVLEM